MISIVACCHGAKLCVHAARDFRSQQPHEAKALLELFCHQDNPIVWIGQMTRTIWDTLGLA